MHTRKKLLPYLFISIFSIAALAGLIYFFSPINNLTFPQANNLLPFTLYKYIQIPPLIIFFILIAITFFCLGSFILKSKAHGILISGFVVTYLLFRLNHLDHPFFLIVLLALFLVLELFVSSRK